MKSITPQEVKAARIAAGLTTTEAAKLIHSGYKVWWQYESGARKMPERTFELFRLKAGSK